MAYPSLRYEGNPVLEIAAGFERKYPEQVLAFYQSGLPKWDAAPSSHSRNVTPNRLKWSEDPSHLD